MLIGSIMLIVQVMIIIKEIKNVKENSVKSQFKILHFHHYVNI